MGRELRELQGLELEPWPLEAAQLRQLGSNVRALSKHNKFLIRKSPAGNPRSMMHPSTLQAQPPGAVGKSRTAGWLGGQARDRLAPRPGRDPACAPPLRHRGDSHTRCCDGRAERHAWQREGHKGHQQRPDSQSRRGITAALQQLGCFWRARRCLVMPGAAWRCLG